MAKEAGLEQKGNSKSLCSSLSLKWMNVNNFFFFFSLFLQLSAQDSESQEKETDCPSLGHGPTKG